MLEQGFSFSKFEAVLVTHKKVRNWTICSNYRLKMQMITCMFDCRIYCLKRGRSSGDSTKPCCCCGSTCSRRLEKSGTKKHPETGHGCSQLKAGVLLQGCTAKGHIQVKNLRVEGIIHKQRMRCGGRSVSVWGDQLIRASLVCCL